MARQKKMGPKKDMESLSNMKLIINKRLLKDWRCCLTHNVWERLNRDRTKQRFIPAGLLTCYSQTILFKRGAKTTTGTGVATAVSPSSRASMRSIYAFAFIPCMHMYRSRLNWQRAVDDVTKTLASRPMVKTKQLQLLFRWDGSRRGMTRGWTDMAHAKEITVPTCTS